MTANDKKKELLTAPERPGSDTVGSSLFTIVRPVEASNSTTRE